jgi:hypothetical protein
MEYPVVVQNAPRKLALTEIPENNPKIIFTKERSILSRN